MRKYTVQCKRGKTSIVEVEIEVIKALEDPSVMWLNPGEYKARVLKPTSFHLKIERLVDGKKETVMEPDVWCWHAFHESLAEAETYSESLVAHEFDFNLRKYGTTFGEADVAAAISAIEVIPLKA